MSFSTVVAGSYDALATAIAYPWPGVVELAIVE
jgi:hypothetical protein